MKIRKVGKVGRIGNFSIAQKGMQSLSSKARTMPAKKKPVTPPKTSFAEMLRELKRTIQTASKDITLDGFLAYADMERVDRAKKQLKVFFVNSFKKGVFTFVVKSSGMTQGEQSYNVKLQFKELESLSVMQSHDTAIKSSNLGIECSCDDFKYRFRYWLTKMKALPSGALQEHRFPKITNAKQEHVFLCKHCILVLNGVSKPSFMNGIFKRYFNNLQQGKRTVRVTKKDTSKSFSSAIASKIKD